MEKKDWKPEVAERLKEMIYVLEVDAARSAGKAKLNSQHLHSMYWLLQNAYKETPNAKKVSKEG